MSHFPERLLFFTKTAGKFSDGHGVVTTEDRSWEEGYRTRWQDELAHVHEVVAHEKLDEHRVLDGRWYRTSPRQPPESTSAALRPLCC